MARSAPKPMSRSALVMDTTSSVRMFPDNSAIVSPSRSVVQFPENIARMFQTPSATPPMLRSATMFPRRSRRRRWRRWRRSRRWRR